MRSLRPFHLVPIFALLLAGCVSLYSGIVGITTTVDGVMKEWANTVAAGKSTEKIDRAVITAHAKYQQAATVARDALKAYKAGGAEGSYQAAFEATRVAALAVIDAITPLLTADKAAKVKSDITKAKTL